MGEKVLVTNETGNFGRWRGVLTATKNIPEFQSPVAG